MTSKKHRDARVRALDDARISTDAFPKDIIASLLLTFESTVSFSYNDLQLEGKDHNMPLFIQVIIKAKRTLYVMVDDGSAINVCPLRLFNKFGITVEDLKASNVIIRAYDYSKKKVIGNFNATITVGKVQFIIEFTVLKFNPQLWSFFKILKADDESRKISHQQMRLIKNDD